MIVPLDRDPFGWVHPFYRRRRPYNLFSDWEHFVRPALETINTLNHMLELEFAQHEPRVVQSLISHRADRDKFEVKIDVSQFAPEELDVKLVDNCLVVEGKHEEKKDEHGFISRQFVRRHQLPTDVKPEMVVCDLSSDGVLLVTAPRMIENKPASERSVPINFTGLPAVTNVEQQSGADNQEQQMEKIA